MWTKNTSKHHSVFLITDYRHEQLILSALSFLSTDTLSLTSSYLAGSAWKLAFWRSFHSLSFQSSDAFSFPFLFVAFHLKLLTVGFDLELCGRSQTLYSLFCPFALTFSKKSERVVDFHSLSIPLGSALMISNWFWSLAKPKIEVNSENKANPHFSNTNPAVSLQFCK